MQPSKRQSRAGRSLGRVAEILQIGWHFSPTQRWETRGYAWPERAKGATMSNSMKPARPVRGITKSLGIVLLLLTSGMLSAQNQEHRVRNIVLVHGAWADGSGWKGVYDILVKDGYNVSIVQEPETSFREDVAATKRILDQQVGPCILVAHSYGGA